MLTARQQRELDYHREWAAENEAEITRPVPLSPLDPLATFRWWNAYWLMLRKAERFNLTSKAALVIGCGFGDDAIQLAKLGATVSAIDLSPESLDIAERRAEIANVSIKFAISPAEKLPYPSETFDLVYLPDVIHHLDIASAMKEVRRVLKPEGTVLANEPYTHSLIQRIRQSPFVQRVLYPRLVRQVYGTAKPYITEDERKLTERDIAAINASLRIVRKSYFLLFVGRLLPATVTFPAKIDRLILMLPWIGYLLAGRVVIEARRRL